MEFEEKKDEIHKAFASYVQAATKVLQRRPSLKEKMVDASMNLAYIKPGLRLRSLVEALENATEFKRLFSALDRAFTSKERNSSTGMPSYSIYTLSLPHFFRRSHFYSDAFENHKVNPDALFESFWSSLLHRKVKTTRLRLLNRVWFRSKTLDFGLFRIQQLAKKELDKLIDPKIRQLFYPSAQVVDTALLSQYWFIIEESWSERGLSVRGELKWRPFTVERNFPDRAIQLLALYEWTPEWMREEWEGDERFWMGFSLPFSFRIDDDVFERPTLIPLVPHLDQVPAELGGGPESPIEIDRKEEAELKNIVAKGKKVIGLLSQADLDWSFVEIAMGYLAKAFLTTEDLDQILWHVAVLDALVSEENAGVRQVMRPRIANILSATEGEKKKVLKQFDELYKFRSSLVHGKSYNRKAEFYHLADARDLARRVLLWFLDYVIWIDNNLSQRGVTHERYPRRPELLSVLGFDKASLDRLHLLVGKLPSTFPDLQGESSS